MTVAAWLQLAFVVAVLAVATPWIGRYLAAVFGDDDRAPLDRFFRPIETRIFRLVGVDPNGEQRWTGYGLSVLAFSAVSVVGLYALLRLQGMLPLNPTDAPAMPSALAFNTAVSFVTNTNWQSYSGEQAVSHLSQMAGLGVQNFVSPAVGLCVAVVLVRSLARHRPATVGNFWVDLVRAILRVLLPLAFVVALVLIAQGTIQNFHGFRSVETVAGETQQLPGGPVAGQEAIKTLGQNGGGFFGTNSAHPYENPTGFTNVLQILSLVMIPFALTFAYGRLVGDRRQGYVLLATMVVFWLGAAAVATAAETSGNPRFGEGVDQSTAAGVVPGNLEGKEIRFGAAACGLYAASTTGTSSGAVDCSHDSLTALGGAAPLSSMMLGEISPGGTGAGLYGILVFAMLTVFIAGLMVGRTPEYLGKKIQATEMKLVVLYLIVVPLVVLGFSAASVVLGSPRSAALNAGPHGLSEIVYAYTSAGNNNGSAFAGLASDTPWYNVTLGLTMLVGRYGLIVPVLAIAGSMARKRRTPPSSGTFPTSGPLFAGLLTGVVLVVVGLTYVPVLVLGPIVEHLGA